MSRSVTISARGFGRVRGTRRGRDAGPAGAGGSVASSHRTTLPGEPASRTSMRTRVPVPVPVPARFTDTVAEFERTAERPRIRRHPPSLP
jgi:hypothetical protein